MNVRTPLVVASIVLSSTCAWAAQADCPRPDLWGRYPQIKQEVDQGLAKLKDDLAALEPEAFSVKHPALAKMAKSKDWAERVRALKAVAALENPTGIPLLVAGIMDAKGQKAIHEALNPLTTWIATTSPRERNKFKPLAPLFLNILVNVPDWPSVRCRCLQALGNLADREWLPIIKELLVSRHPAVTNMSTWVIQQVSSRSCTRGGAGTGRPSEKELAAIIETIKRLIQKPLEKRKDDRIFYSDGVAWRHDGWIPTSPSMQETPPNASAILIWRYRAGRLYSITITVPCKPSYVSERFWYNSRGAPILSVHNSVNGQPCYFQWGDYDRNGLLRRVVNLETDYSLDRYAIHDNGPKYSRTVIRNFDAQARLTSIFRYADNKMVYTDIRNGTAPRVFNRGRRIDYICRLKALNLAPIYPIPTCAGQDKAAPPPKREDEAADRKMGEEAVRLLTKGDYTTALAAVDRDWRQWRNRYAGVPQPQIRLTESGLVFPPYDPTKTYERQPSQTVADAARDILDLLYANSGPEMVGPLLAVSTPELAEHAYTRVMSIGVQMCKDGRGGKGIEAIYAAQRAMEKRKIEPNTKKWAYPRLAKREPDWYVLRELQTALTGNDPRELLAGYRAIRPDKDKAKLAEMVVHIAAHQPIPSKSARSILVVEAALDDKRPALRKMAADELNWRNSLSFDPAGAAALLLKHVNDPDAGVRFCVARSLVSWGNKAGLKPLMASTQTDFGNHGIPLNCIGRMGARSATDWIVRVGTKYPDYRRQESVRALWVLGDPAAIDYLGKILLDPNENKLTRVLAAGALGATMDDKAFPFMAKALASAEGKLADKIITHLTEIRPKLSFPILCRSMAKAGLLDGGDWRKRKLNEAWLRLHKCSGYGDVIGQYFQDRTKLQAGMQEYWDGRRKLHDLARQIQYYRYIVPDRDKEQAARRELDEAKKKVPTRCLNGWSGPAIPQ